MGPTDVDQLQRINEDLAAALGRGDVVAQIALDFAFHRAISERGGNRRLSQILDDLRSQLHRLEQWYYSYPTHSRRSILEHDQIIQALREGDQARATEILRDNMSLTKVALFEGR